MDKCNDKCFELADKIICLDYKNAGFFFNCYPLTDYFQKMKFKSTKKMFNVNKTYE